jgi:hypothetical protein
MRSLSNIALQEYLYGFPDTGLAAMARSRLRVLQAPPYLSDYDIFAEGLRFVRSVDRDITPNGWHFRQCKME